MLLRASVVLVYMSASLSVHAAVTLQNLQTEYRKTPLGIDVVQPRFSWQMAATAGERGLAQKSYQVEVRDGKGTLVWDSKPIAEAGSVGIKYGGAALSPETRYRWTVNVWPNQGAKITASSWFETGVMNPSPTASAWAGAQWIGGGNEDLVLYAPYFGVFDLQYAVTIAPGSTRAGFVWGANDPRLLDKNKNIYQVQNAKNQSYLKLVLDIAGVDGSTNGKAKLHVYRAGYKDTDNAATPVKSFDIVTDLINAGNKNAEHVVGFRSTFGQITITIDGKGSFTGDPEQPQGPPGFPGRRLAPNAVNLNPAGTGADYIAFGLLCDIGFQVDPGQSATYRNLTLRNVRKPGNVVFSEDLARGNSIFASAGIVKNGAYSLQGGERGQFVVRDPSRNSAPMLRTAFRATKAIDSARLYVTARGIYDVFINGQRVGNDHYNPGLTQYSVTHLYQTYDVTNLLRAGDNAMGAMLAEGWWSGLLSFGTVWNHFGDRQSLFGKLVVRYKDGSADTITTNDRDWKFFGNGPVVYSSFDFGEIYDSGRERAVEGWSTASYNDRQWRRAQAVPLEGTAFIGPEIGFGGRPGTPLTYDKLSLVGQIGDSAGVFRTLKAKSMREVRPGVYVYDMGQNIVGVPRIRLASGRPGGQLTLRYSEMLYPQLAESGKNTGMLMTENYRAALSTDVYVMKAGAQTIQPRFTSHGYQYVEITGVDHPMPLDAVEGVVISSIRELTADFKSSNAKVNQLWSNLVWSNIDNFLSIPTDCPQRNERMGWSGDINVFSRTATYVSNADQFMTRHMYAMRDTQSPSGRFTDIAPVGGGFGGVLWGSAGVVVPWETYLQYNDVGLLERHYPAMAAYVDYLEGTIDAKTGLSTDAQLGDWLGPQNNMLGAAFLATAYHAYDLGIVARAAEILGKTADAPKYRDRYEKRKAFFNSTFVNNEGKTMSTGGADGFGGFGGRQNGPPTYRPADTQTSYAVGLGMNLFDSARVSTIAKHLADAVVRENKDDSGKTRPKYSLMTGFIGTAWIGKALSDAGYNDLAYRLLENDQYPSWLYAVDQGATTIWERLNGYTVENGFGGNNSMNSFNHYSFGAVGQWMMAYALGIQRGEPGFQKFVLQPEPDPTGVMKSAEGYYDSMYGRITSAWKVDGGTLTYRATVPPNTTATLYLQGKSEKLTEGARYVKQDGVRSVYELVSGTYEFVIRR